MDILTKVKDNIMNGSCLIHKLVMKHLDVEILEKSKGKIGMSENGFMNYQKYGLSNWAWKWKKKRRTRSPIGRVAGYGPNKMIQAQAN